MKTIWIKGLIMAIFVAIGTVLTSETVNVPILILTVLFAMIGYIAQHKLFPSTSPAYVLVFQDFFSAIFLGIFAAGGNSLATFIVGGTICWICLWKLVVSVVIGYLTKTIPSEPVNSNK
jgi:hypothetical protein